jgi:hypothetical protein
LDFQIQFLLKQSVSGRIHFPILAISFQNLSLHRLSKLQHF